MTPTSTRLLDSLGRIVLPLEYRSALGLQPGDAVCISLTQEGILLTKRKAVCVRCGGTKDVFSLGEGAFICEACAEALCQKRNGRDEG